MNTIIEVGANLGTDTIKFLEHPDNIVYAFEPTVELQSILQSKFKDYPNFNLIPAAVDLTNSFKWFNVAGSADWGCSSLHEFQDDLENKWPDRPDFHTTHRYKVMTLRLDTFIQNYNIPRIDYLWIDAQGNDFNVLKSLGNCIDRVEQGKCEASLITDLYKNTDNRADDLELWLQKANFGTSRHLHGPGVSHEVDIHFYRTLH